MRSAIVYKIIDRLSDDVYVGATFSSLQTRFREHFHKDCTVIGHLMHANGVERYQPVLIKQYDVVDRKHLSAIETLWIRKLRCINVIPPFVISAMTIKFYRQQYYLANRSRLLQRATTRVLCECGISSLRANLCAHRRSQRHARLLLSLDE